MLFHNSPRTKHRSVDKVILLLSKQSSKCGKIDKKEAPDAEILTPPRPAFCLFVCESDLSQTTPKLFLSVMTSIYLVCSFVNHTHDSIHIGLCRQKLPHFLTGTPVLGIGLFLFFQQFRVLRLQLFDLWKLLDAHLIKGILSSLVEQNFFLIFFPEFLRVTRLALCHIDLTSLGIIYDVSTQNSDLCHALFSRFDLRRKFIVMCRGSRSLFFQNRIL